MNKIVRNLFIDYLHNNWNGNDWGDESGSLRAMEKEFEESLSGCFDIDVKCSMKLKNDTVSLEIDDDEDIVFADVITKSTILQIIIDSLESSPIPTQRQVFAKIKEYTLLYNKDDFKIDWFLYKDLAQEKRGFFVSYTLANIHDRFYVQPIGVDEDTAVLQHSMDIVKAEQMEPMDKKCRERMYSFLKHRTNIDSVDQIVFDAMGKKIIFIFDNVGVIFTDLKNGCFDDSCFKLYCKHPKDETLRQNPNNLKVILSHIQNKSTDENLHLNVLDTIITIEDSDLQAIKQYLEFYGYEDIDYIKLRIKQTEKGLND